MSNENPFNTTPPPYRDSPYNPINIERKRLKNIGQPKQNSLASDSDIEGDYEISIFDNRMEETPNQLGALIARHFFTPAIPRTALEKAQD